MRKASLTVFAVGSPYAWDVVESALRLGLRVICVDNLGGADAGLPGLIGPDGIDGASRGPFVVGVASADHRGLAAEAARTAGFTEPVALIDPTAVVASTVTVAHGAYLNAGVVVGSQADLGCHSHVNRSASVGHHARVGYAASLGPAAVLAGHVEVAAGAFVGAGATVLPGVRIGRHAVVGAGAVVTKDVEDHTVVVGNPARSVRRRDSVSETQCPHC